MNQIWYIRFISLSHVICVIGLERNLNELHVGYLVSWTGAVEGRRFAGAITRVIEDINKDPNILNGTTLKYSWGNSGCNYTMGLGAAVDLYNKGVSVFLGPTCSKACISVGYLSTIKEMPMISYSCSTVELDNKDLYPYSARVKPFVRGSIIWTPKSFVALIKRFNWTQVCVIRRMDALYFRLGEETVRELERNNIEVRQQEVYYVNTFQRKGEIINETKDNCRIFVLIGSRHEVTEIMIHAFHLGLTKKPGYAFLTLDYRMFKTDPIQLQWWNRYLGSSYTTDFLNNNIMEGLISVKAQNRNESDPDYIKFKEDVLWRVQQDPFNDTIILQTNGTINNIAGYLYDTTMLYARTVDRMLRKGENIHNATALVAEMKLVRFEGQTGHVQLDSNLTRIPTFLTQSIHNGKLTTMGYFDAVSNTEATLNNRFHFPGGTMEVPNDHPPCAFDDDIDDDERCHEHGEEFNYILLVILAPFIVTLVIAALVYIYKKKRYEVKMISKELIINVTDISFSDESQWSTRSKISAMNVGGNLAKRLGDSRMGGNFASFSRCLPTSGAKVACYKSNRVFLKTYPNCKVDLTWDLLLQLKQIKDINHTNVNMFFGVVSQGTTMHVAWSYCSKGSLQDVLQNDDLDIDWMFKLSFAFDIMKGLAEIHQSSIGVHGNLNSSNCLVDNRWVCKLSNFGMQMFESKDKDNGNLPMLKKELWKAPELLSGSKAVPTKESDIYSYGMIMYEIHSREDIFGIELRDNEMSIQEVVNVLKAGDEGPFRPMVTDTTDVPEGYLELMQRCWDDIAERRPHMKEVSKIITKLQKESHKGGSIVDHMLMMMEKYTDNLEGLVAERTHQLELEKEKTENLLYKMLPKSVANKLKEGQLVLPENFDAVTIFFSDIVGFTALCAESTPIEVVEMLNDLYSCFDNCVDQHDVYKVETIGDAYMVVSGLPIRNENRHAGEIASMALDLLSEVTRFKINHRPEMQMQLRIGIHTGSCVAGVVGVKMPRYCLFGDTVNYASRMESSGLALRIHVSPECKTVLDSLGGYALLERGAVQMKGKGSVVTYFLTGKDGFDKPLPDLSLAASLQEHSFK